MLFCPALCDLLDDPARILVSAHDARDAGLNHATRSVAVTILHYLPASSRPLAAHWLRSETMDDSQRCLQPLRRPTCRKRSFVVSHAVFMPRLLIIACRLARCVTVRDCWSTRRIEGVLEQMIRGLMSRTRWHRGAQG